MTTQTRIGAVAATLLLAAIVPPASAQYVDMIVRVPFEFHVAGDSMPRDVYRISRAHNGSSALMLRGERRGIFVLTRQGKPYSGAQTPQLVFHRIGNQYFLREVQLLGSSALDVPETPAEREALRQIADGAPAAVERVVIRGAR
jgi:hypothetical protein